MYGSTMIQVISHTKNINVCTLKGKMMLQLILCIFVSVMKINTVIFMELNLNKIIIKIRFLDVKVND